MCIRDRSVDVERALSAEETTNFYDYTPEDDPQIQRAVLSLIHI